MDTHESTCSPEWLWVGLLYRVLFSGEGRGGGGILADWVQLCCSGSSSRPGISAHGRLLPSWIEASCFPTRKQRPSHFSLGVLVAGLLDSASFKQVNAKHKGKGKKKVRLYFLSRMGFAGDTSFRIYFPFDCVSSVLNFMHLFLFL